MSTIAIRSVVPARGGPPVVPELWLLLILVALVACRDASARALTYGAELAECHNNARARFPQNNALACEDSIACENRARVKFHRPLRDPSKGCE